MKIEIITSKNAELKETGFGSVLACNDVLASVELLGHTVQVTECGSMEDLSNVVRRNPDMVILGAKYMPVAAGDDVWFSEYFEQNHIIFSGSTRETLKYDSDKVLAKVHLASLGVKTAKFFTAIPGEYKVEKELPFQFPLFLKPTDAANGNGIDDQSFVENFQEFEAKVLSLYTLYQQPILAEEYLGGREFTVAVIKGDNDKMSVSAIELIPPVSSGTLRILGAAVKLNDSEELKEILVADIGSVMDIAALSFNGLGARGFARIDVKTDNEGVCYFMEANLVPGMNRGTSYFPRACGIANKMQYDDVIGLMLDESFERVVARQASVLPVHITAGSPVGVATF
ncbi:D-alanine--D-alanine ligase family protein [Teredinibacter purpureus]|uniref:D-alanine--D-alanine ligase n=1 Tax=Teredinibacter purpureus TaxID=2731756 RepID=UPI0005F777FD|nr:D-alanine--D-alanine ligase [Teredinibacter purpureus]